MADDPHIPFERLMEFMNEHLMLSEEEHQHLLNCPDCRRLLIYGETPRQKDSTAGI
jgi:hypothetical protein